MRKLFRRLWKDEFGEDLIEYALLVVLIALIAVSAVAIVGLAVSNAFASF